MGERSLTLTLSGLPKRAGVSPRGYSLFSMRTYDRHVDETVPGRRALEVHPALVETGVRAPGVIQRQLGLEVVTGELCSTLQVSVSPVDSLAQVPVSHVQAGSNNAQSVQTLGTFIFN